MEKLTITDINGFGDGVTRLDNKAIFIPKALPEDQIKITNIQDFKRYSKAQVSELIIKSPHRETPFCEHFNNCGGCQIQNVKSNSYKSIKLKIFKNLSRYVLKDRVENIIIGENKTEFRNKAVFNFSLDNLQLYYQGINNEEIIINKCEILEKSLQQVLSLLQKTLINYPQLKDQGLKKVLLKSLPNQKPILGFDIKKHPSNQSLLQEISLEIKDSISGIFYFHSPSSHFAVSQPTWLIKPQNPYEIILDINVPYSPEMFFQSNREIMTLIYQEISQWVLESKSKNILDLYTGVGGTLFCMQNHIDFGLGLEVNSSSIKIAKSIKSQQNYKNLSFQTANLPRGLKSALRNQAHFDLCVVNPPRKGLGQKMIKETISHLPDKIIYLSCNPSTLESDLKQFEKEGYQLLKCKVFDMFPWTNHFETLTLIQKK
ncbi:MAG: 23S rRNA (uracil(1939)-C(5))-methyltransferase RlmD [Candidatus Cloacimonadota bacterium]|nr:MAG: 23S rRNA (uracil(1939)-C(5))-methyltransferase RlmD [Candidatus Cloacimonadota bacterium]